MAAALAVMLALNLFPPGESGWPRLPRAHWFEFGWPLAFWVHQDSFTPVRVVSGVGFACDAALAVAAAVITRALVLEHIDGRKIAR